MKHPNCYICKSEILGDAYAHRKYFFCKEHFIESRKRKLIKNLKKDSNKSNEVVL